MLRKQMHLSSERKEGRLLRLTGLARQILLLRPPPLDRTRKRRTITLLHPTKMTLQVRKRRQRAPKHPIKHNPKLAPLPRIQIAQRPMTRECSCLYTHNRMTSSFFFYFFCASDSGECVSAFNPTGQYIPRLVASSKSCVSTAAAGMCTERTTEPRINVDLTAN